MSKLLSVLAVLLVVVAVAPPLGAATMGAEVFGAFNTYSMEDVNDALEADNSAGADYEELTSGMTGGLGLRIWPSPSWMVAATWEPLFLETESEPTSSRWNLDANSFQVTAYRFFPSSTNSRFGIGAGVGFYTVAGENEDPALVPTTLAIEGSGAGFHVLGMSEWTVSPGFAFTAGAGYRFADIELDDSTNDSTADYSGFMARVGLAFYMPESR